MQTKFTSPVKGSNKGSSARITNYLEKENDKNLSNNKEYFFSADRNTCNKYEVISQIDANGERQKLEKKDDRFYSIIISPSQAELAHIGNDSHKLKEYTRQVMENYAANFCNSKGENRGMNSHDLVWYAKVEHERKHGFDSPEVKAGLAESGELKQGDQRHIHIIVSRCEARENRHVLGQENKQEQTTHLCPTVNNQKMFNRDAFIRANERAFDQQFGYARPLEERYDYCNGLKNGHHKHYQAALDASQRQEAKHTQEQSYTQQKATGLSMGL